MTNNLLIYSVVLFAGLFTLGTLLCLQLYKWNYKKYFHSSLWVKTSFWIPIFIIFLATLYLKIWAVAVIMLFIATQSLRELQSIKRRDTVAWLYAVIVIAAMAHLALFFVYPNTAQVVALLLIIGFSSVLSDVFAYFFGNFIGKHKLPEFINPGKSWEGVAGQIIGAVVGFYCVAPAITSAPSVVFALLIGSASTLGDITNSIVKRRLHIKDWGNTIPGHGGVLDRFSSLSFAIALSYWWLILFN